MSRCFPWPMFFASLFGCCLFLAGMFSFDHNDHMYFSSAFVDGILYEEIHFVQAPLSYYLNKLVTLTTYLDPYLAMRLLPLIGLVLIYWLLQKKLSSVEAKLFLVVFLFASFYVLKTSQEIGSYVAPLLMSVIAFVLLWHMSFSRVAVFGITFFSATAVSFKLSFLPLGLVFCLMCLYQIFVKRKVYQLFIPFLLGGLTGGLPILIHSFLNFEQFVEHNLTFHSVYTNEYRGLTAQGSFENIVNGFRKWFERGDGLFLIAASVLVYSREQLLFKKLLVALTFISIIFGIVLAGVIFPQYLLPLSVISIFVSVYYLQPEIQAKSKWLIAVFAIFSVKAIAAVPWQSIASDRTVYAERKEVVARLDIALDSFKADCTHSIFSFSGVVAGNGYIDFSPLMSSGIFWSRLGQNPNIRVLKPQLTQPGYEVLEQDLAVVGGFYSDHPSELELLNVLHTAERDYKVEEIGVFQGREIKVYLPQSCASI